jgi:hypothetical protein
MQSSHLQCNIREKEIQNQAESHHAKEYSVDKKGNRQIRVITLE